MFKRLQAHTREQLYAARRFPVNRAGGLSAALRQLRIAMDTEGVLQECRERRFMYTPSHSRNMCKFFKRQSEFKAKVTHHVQRIMEIEESLK